MVVIQESKYRQLGRPEVSSIDIADYLSAEAARSRGMVSLRGPQASMLDEMVWQATDLRESVKFARGLIRRLPFNTTVAMLFLDHSGRVDASHEQQQSRLDHLRSVSPADVTTSPFFDDVFLSRPGSLVDFSSAYPDLLRMGGRGGGLKYVQAFFEIQRLCALLGRGVHERYRGLFINVTPARHKNDEIAVANMVADEVASKNSMGEEVRRIIAHVNRYVFVNSEGKVEICVLGSNAIDQSFNRMIALGRESLSVAEVKKGKNAPLRRRY